MNVLVEMKRMQDLSSAERQVVNYILNDPATVINIGIVNLAQKAFTSTSTVMRVCKRLGFDSFVEFRTNVAQSYCDYVESDLLHSSPPEIDRESDISSIIDKVTANNAHAITTVKSINSEEMLSRVVDMMSAAKQWDFYGLGISNLICQDAAFKAMRLGIPATAYVYTSQSAILSKCSEPGKNLAFFVSYTGQTTEILTLADNIKQMGVPSVSLTSQTDNDLLSLCDINLFVDSLESIYRIGGMSSRISTLHLFDILFSIYMNRHFDETEEMARKTFIADTFGKVYRKDIL